MAAVNTERTYMTTPFFYVPLLHKNHLSVAVPESVQFIPCGLPEVESTGFEPVVAAIMAAFPFKPVESKAVLNDMLRLGEEYAPGGLLSQLALQQPTPYQEKWKSPPGELEAIQCFSETGTAPEGAAAPQVPQWAESLARADETMSAIRQTVMDCQKTLLLIHALEERSWEMKQLEERYYGAEKALQYALGEDSAEAAVSSAAAGSAAKTPDAASVPAVPWRVMVDATLPFLPDNAMLFTNDQNMAMELRAAGMLQPLPENKAAACEGWAEPLISGLLYVSLPAWRLVGRRGPAAERPWLEREIEVFVARPPQGWTEAAL